MSETSIQFSALRKSIKRLQKASQILDIEKAEAEEHFKRLLNKLPGRKAHELEEADEIKYTLDLRDIRDRLHQQRIQ